MFTPVILMQLFVVLGLVFLFLSPKVRTFGWHLASEISSNQTINSCGIDISVKLHLVIMCVVIGQKHVTSLPIIYGT